ncbi:hypothetical protein JMJ77_0007445 [Colletotrichum scovillei]|uniref:Uncharacterized protein n=1 Tax=Colletotrichum scovillei TaxID=1209932 RepID=A0A9P7RCJ1_9PEZI|nr:hypothetical protein JMJ77_0007445 [Colletotrichum scovillei]KAG7074420.1 hypothetical protein JMJ76_0010899 [Colletotrichum scovillei]KAG7081390.1 hypothetical protein JMJ78_0003513 [Colletotrichum scovillei]
MKADNLDTYHARPSKVLPKCTYYYIYIHTYPYS